MPLVFASCKTAQKTMATSSETTAHKKSPPAHAQLSKEDKEKCDRLFMEAEKEKVTEDWDEAIKNYKLVLETDPYNSDAHFQIAQIYLNQNKLSDAEGEALAAIKTDGQNKWYLEMLAGIYMNEGKAKEATETFKTLVDKFPGNPDYYLNLAYLYSKGGQFENAIKTYDAFEKNFGIDENVIEEKKNLYLHLNRFNDAVNEVHKLVEAYPGETKYMLMEADLYRANKMTDKAADLYKKVLVIEPDNADALLALADIGAQGGGTADNFENLKKIFANPKVDIDTKIKILFPYLQFWDIKKEHKQQAFELAEIMTETHPEEAKGFALKGDLYYLDNQTDKALQSYLKALELNKDVFQVWQQVMLIYNSNRDWANLEKTCDEAADLFPNQATVFLFKGGAEYQNKEYDKAVKSFSKGEKMSGDNDKLRAQFLADLGDVYHSLNNNAESDSAYEKSLKYDGENAYVLNNYSYYLSLRKENLEKAKEMSAYSNKLDPDNSSFLDTYAWILFQLSDFAGAKEWQEKAMKAGGDKSGTILEHYGDILFKLGDKDKALEYWKKAKELGTDSTTIDRKISEQKYVE
ncbi:MAG TPA: tetratricopeptide repeat protein [Chitinophagales bacterium]|nr:tetratricopeptide repeat protein [Chitinophagales bacterium]